MADMADDRKFPNFFVVGAAKSGTTSLWEYLKMHPQVFMPPDEMQKEPNYFCPLGDGMSDFEDYISIFDGAKKEEQIVGEATTAYLTCPKSAGMIYEYEKKYKIGVKIIILLRNPAERAYSLYNWNVQEGYDYGGSFKYVLKKEPERLKSQFPFFLKPRGYKYNYFYFNSGLYYDQVKRYLDIFGEENVHIDLFEEFVKNTSGSLNRIYKFLGIDEIPLPEITYLNSSHDTYSPLLQYSLRKLTKLLEKVRLISRKKGKEHRDQLLKLGWKTSKPPKLSVELRSELLKRYEEDVSKLEALTGLKASQWLT